MLGLPIRAWLAAGILLGLAFTQPSAVFAQQRPVVVIDPGHGGEAAGVDHEGWLEKDLVLRIGFAIGAEFVDAGWDVVYTRTRDEDVPWERRRSAAEEAGGTILLMLHANGDEDTSQHGAEVYAYLGDPGSARLASLIEDALSRSGSAVIVEERDWPFLQSSSVATAMIELAFMTHPVERRLLKTSAFHHELGRALAGAATEFLERR